MVELSPPQPRTIVVCCDGTANEFRKDNTNVVRLYSVLAHQSADQVACYHPGLGTMEAVGALTNWGRWFTKQLGKVSGYGLESDLRDLYVFLMRHHRPGDRVFLFGFSRGAYTVRALVGLLHFYGLMDPPNEAMVPYAIRLLVAANRTMERNATSRSDVFELAGRFKATFGQRRCPVHFVGVWDTVGSVGWLSNPLKVPGTANCEEVSVARHAMALDERRAFFRPNRFVSIGRRDAARPPDLKEVWFAGVHSDVGGGYPAEADPSKELWRFSLAWMLREAERAGLRIDPAKRDKVLSVVPDADAPMHESLRGWWKLAEFVPKNVRLRRPDGSWRQIWRINLFRSRAPRLGDRIHRSTAARGGYSGRVEEAVVEN